MVRGLSTRDLAHELEKKGRPIPATGITRIEKGARTVDVDDLLTLSVVLRVSPISLLFPPVSGDVMADVTAVGPLPTWKLWKWARAMEPLSEPISEDDYADFQMHAVPKGVRKYVRRGERTPEELEKRRAELMHMANRLYRNDPAERDAFLERQRLLDPEPWDV